jgi:hypothetical protein
MSEQDKMLMAEYGITSTVRRSIGTRSTVTTGYPMRSVMRGLIPGVVDRQLSRKHQSHQRPCSQQR